MARSERECLCSGAANDIPRLIRGLAADAGRRIPLAGTLNFRDVGGYPTADGGTIGWRRLLRSDALHRLDGDAAVVLARLDLRTVLDLRTSEEVRIAPSPPDGLIPPGAVTTHISLVGEDLTALPADLDGIYRFIVDRRGAAIGAAVRFLAKPGGLPALVHCSAGKDRTGIVVAFVLAAVGVPDQVIAADYALSGRYLDPTQTPAIGRVRADTGMGDRLTEALMASPPELIAGILARVRQQAGTIEGYLTSHGVTAAELGALRTALVTGGPGRWPGDGDDCAAGGRGRVGAGRAASEGSRVASEGRRDDCHGSRRA